MEKRGRREREIYIYILYHILFIFLNHIHVHYIIFYYIILYHIICVYIYICSEGYCQGHMLTSSGTRAGLRACAPVAPLSGGPTCHWSSSLSGGRKAGGNLGGFGGFESEEFVMKCGRKLWLNPGNPQIPPNPTPLTKKTRYQDVGWCSVPIKRARIWSPEKCRCFQSRPLTS